jgi:D-tyrosyl-tRNA(Tyr) deacylase
MRAVVQRTSRATVREAGTALGEIGPGLDDAIAGRLASRVATLRVFADASGRMNLDLAQSGGAVLLISQFTLWADTSRGHRPSIIGAAAPDQAERLCDAFAAALRARDLSVATGRFGAHMEVELVNDGPVTLVMSSGEGGWDADAG